MLQPVRAGMAAAFGAALGAGVPPRLHRWGEQETQKGLWLLGTRLAFGREVRGLRRVLTCVHDLLAHWRCFQYVVLTIFLRFGFRKRTQNG